MQRRVLSIVLVAGLIGLPAAVLRFACVGKSCPAKPAAALPVPFCPLPAPLKTAIAAGYVNGRSPDVFGAPFTEGSVTGGSPDVSSALAWPAVSPPPDTSIPLVFEGAGVHAGPLPAGTGLDQVAPTLATIMGFQRSHPDVRAGVSIRSVGRTARPRLVLMIAWTGVGSSGLAGHLAGTPWLQQALRSGAGTLHATTGSLPADPAATLTTMGTGGLPRQHGITGSVLIGAGGDVVPAWGTGAPRSIIATLADDWSFSQPSSSMGLIAPSAQDRGLIGGNWYVGHGPVDLRIGTDPVTAESTLLHSGYGKDGVTDILGVVLDDPVARMDAETASLVQAAEAATGGSVTVVVAGTGQQGPTGAITGPSVTGSQLAARIDGALHAPGLVTGSAGGGVFLSNTVMTAHGLSTANVSATMSTFTGPGGSRLFSTTFPGFAIGFGRYCP